MSGSRESADGPQHPGDGGKAPPAEPSPPGEPGAPGRPSAPSDGELTRRLRREYRSGTADAAVCDLLYRRHRRAALAYARTCCRTPQDAEDLVSEAFARTLQAVRSGAGPRGPWRAYLLAVVRHTAMQWSDGDGRTLLTADFDTWCQQAAAGGDPQRRLLAGEDRRLLARSFRALPARWRAVLWHTLVEEDSPHEIAALLGITPSAVTSLAFRAREGCARRTSWPIWTPWPTAGAATTATCSVRRSGAAVRSSPAASHAIWRGARPAHGRTRSCWTSTPRCAGRCPPPCDHRPGPVRTGPGRLLLLLSSLLPCGHKPLTRAIRPTTSGVKSAVTTRAVRRPTREC